MTALSREQLSRYSRHIMLPELGTQGQQTLFESRVLVVGAGGLGSPIIMYLAAAGIGELGIVDGDVVELSNLQRQVLYETSELGLPKAVAARRRVQAINPDVRVAAYVERLTPQNSVNILEPYQVVVDATDNFASRYLLSDTCVLLDRPLVHGGVYRFEGQATVFNANGGPCYRCVFPEPPRSGGAPRASDKGILGVIPGIIGVVQANEVIKLLLGIGKPLAGRLLLYNALDTDYQIINVLRSPDCPVCGEHPSVTTISEQEELYRE